MPSFSTRVTDHEGGEILEVLCDQKPWGDTFTYDEHFRFGPFKARMIIAAQSVISEFVESDGAKPDQGVTIVARDDSTDRSFSPSCSTYDHFFCQTTSCRPPILEATDWADCIRIRCVEGRSSACIDG
jgi:hypothetical protein